MCCANGKDVLPPQPAALEPLASLLAGTHDDDSKNFLTNVMRYSSFGGIRKLDADV